MIITIARQCGCMGDQIGKALAEKYFIPFYDKDAVCRLAKEKGLYEKYPYFYGEMPLDMMLYADTMAGDDTSDNGKTPRKAMADIIGNENCVVVGRCGNNAFRHREDVISVFLTGNKEKRRENKPVVYGCENRSRSCLKRNADDTDYFINIVLSAFRHLCFISSCDYLISCCSVAQFLQTLYLLPSVGFVWKAGVRFLQYRGIGQRVFV